TAALHSQREQDPDQPEQAEQQGCRRQGKHDLVAHMATAVDPVARINGRIGLWCCCSCCSRCIHDLSLEPHNQVFLPSAADNLASMRREAINTKVVIRNRIRPNSIREDFCKPPASLNSLAMAEAIELDGSKTPPGRRNELPMTNVTAMVSPNARPRPSMMPPITPVFV